MSLFGVARYRYMARRIVLQNFARRIRRSLVIGESLLIVAPHPDDETFGTGQLISAATRCDSLSPSRIDVVFLTSGNASHHGCCDVSDAEVASKREATATRAAAILGLPESRLHFLRLRDGELPHPGEAGFEDSCRQLAHVISHIKPKQIFTTNPCEGWPDHVAAAELTRSALGQSRLESELYYFCVWFWIAVPLVTQVLRADWSNALVLGDASTGSLKKQAIRTYLEDRAACGNPYCGILPKELLRAADWGQELFFHVRKAR